MNRVLFISPVAFSGLQQRHQSLAAEMAKGGWQVSFVDPLKTGGFSCSVNKTAQNLAIIGLQVPFKGTAWPAIQKICAKFAMLLLRSKLASSDRATLLWISEPSLAWLSQYGWQTIIYDRCDLHGEFPGQNKWAWQKYENLLFEKATLISCSHEYLQQSLPENARSKSVLAGNACADIFFAQRQSRQAKGSMLKLVSSGAHHEWVDSQWLAMLCNHAE
ncbi:MAG: hypothetical protein ACD_39C00596G0001, partial [uncultured bacterium]